MPSSIIIPASINPSNPVLKPTSTFTGEVYLELLHSDPSAAIANVTFTPCARTYWHTHEGGQLIRVISGSGFLCDKGQEARRIKAGDTIWAPAGTTHWHGADEGSIMMHSVIGIGETKWHDAVTDEDYKKRASD
ncbi:cupin domain-containing protein [Rutstroemia sp. NJR-2017a WRK4]|nr:cupin domain-containing protein [Rutstroemia sp. NJR-2017a WRK4]